MNRNPRILPFLVLALAALGGCSSQPPANSTKQAAAPLDKIQGKAQVMADTSRASDAAMNAGGPTVFLWEGARRYRLFLMKPVDVVHGKQYIAEGVIAQRVIDELGDPDQGKNGYPLQASCEKVIRMAWNNLAFDATDANASLLRTTVKRYPARLVFLVVRLRPADEPEKKPAEEKELPEITLPPDKLRASLVEGSTVLPAPLFEPKGGTVSCKLLIDQEGKVEELQTGNQLCENVVWNKFKFQPPTQKGKPVKVKSELEVRFEERK